MLTTFVTPMRPSDPSFAENDGATPFFWWYRKQKRIKRAVPNVLGVVNGEALNDVPVGQIGFTSQLDGMVLAKYIVGLRMVKTPFVTFVDDDIVPFYDLDIPVGALVLHPVYRSIGMDGSAGQNFSQLKQLRPVYGDRMAAAAPFGRYFWTAGVGVARQLFEAALSLKAEVMEELPSILTRAACLMDITPDVSLYCRGREVAV